MVARDDQIILYANNHHRSNTCAAAAALVAHGYRNVRTYPGGLADWQAAGYPVEGNNVATGSRRRPFGRRRHQPDLQGGCPHCDNGWSGYGWPPAPAATAVPAHHQQPAPSQGSCLALGEVDRPRRMDAKLTSPHLIAPVITSLAGTRPGV